MPGRRAVPVRKSPVLRLRARSVALLVLAFGLTLLALRVVEAAERVIGWMLVAVVAAGLLHPLVSFLARRVPRGLAVVGVALFAVGTLGFVGYAVVGDVSAATETLQREAPEAARRIEESERFGELARTVELREKVAAFVADVPERLRGGTPADALRAAATRGVAFLTTGVLTLFLLLHGPDLARAALRQIPDAERRARWHEVLATAYRRAFGYARGTLLMAVLAGSFAYGLARGAEVPGAAALGVWAGLWDVVPLVGAVAGTLPVVVLAAVADPVKGVVAAIAVIAYQTFEDVLLEPRLEETTMRLGPFLTVAAGLAGLEMRGAPGALLAVLLVAFAAAVLDEVAPDDQPRS